MTYQVRMKQMPQEDRPREKLWALGEKNLSDAELLAILLGSGNKEMGALQLAESVLQSFQGLRNLNDASVEELMQSAKGIGEAKAITIKAALELGRRLGSSNPHKVFVRSPEDVKKLLMEEMRYFDREHVRVLFLDQKSRLLGIEEISVGGLSFSFVCPREVFKPAIKRSSASVILVHNHPSGDPAPSVKDIEITEQMVRAGEIVGISVIDHVIIGDGKYYSLKAWGYL